MYFDLYLWNTNIENKLRFDTLIYVRFDVLVILSLVVGIIVHCLTQNVVLEQKKVGRGQGNPLNMGVETPDPFL